ncbi:putative beta-glucosidase [Lupinus albus]|uniref:Putative beta-glucosidase n=1 Tax=Lupinus albus TaxID=3870 RepID=A0A6A4NRD5_LUPAL|nr:putative beta-glucosidase [Lupinus albus]
MCLYMGMAFNILILWVLTLVIITSSITLIEAVMPILVDVASLNRSSFPDGFIFGTASSSYQVGIYSHIRA